MYLKKAVLIFLFIFILKSAVFSWGGTGHNWILKESIKLLQDDIKTFYLQYENDFINNVMEPDLRKGGDENEGPRHYVNPELYKAFGFTLDNIPWKESEAIKKVGETNMKEFGVVTWAIVATFNKLVVAIKSNDKAGIIRYGADLAHYVGDSHQPLHLTDNYNGQLTGNLNIHFRFEMDLVDERIIEVPQPPLRAPQMIEKIEAYPFEQIKKIVRFVPDIMKADNAAVAVSNLYDDKYYRVLWRDTRNILITSLTEGAYALSDYYHTAYLKAKPAAKTVSPVFKKNTPSKK